MENRLNFQLVIRGLELWTSTHPIRTTGSGIINPGLYAIDGFTQYNSLEELRGTASCSITVTNSIVSVVFKNGSSKAVGEFEGGKALPITSLFSGTCELVPIEGL